MSLIRSSSVEQFLFCYSKMRRSPPCWFFINFSWEFIHGMMYVIVVQQLKCLDFFPPGNPDYFVFIYLSWFFLKWFYFSSQLAYLERFKKFRYLFFQVMYKLLVPLLRYEVPDMRDSVINGLYFLVYNYLYFHISCLFTIFVNIWLQLLDESITMLSWIWCLNLWIIFVKLLTENKKIWEDVDAGTDIDLVTAVTYYFKFVW